MSMPHNFFKPAATRCAVTLVTAAGVLSLCLSPAAAQTQNQIQSYPGKPIRIIVPLAPGGTGDTLARFAAAKLSEAFNQQVVVDNRLGANGIIGTDLVAKATPDGYTLLSGSTAQIVINPVLYGKKLPFDAARDLLPVTQIATTTSVVIATPSFGPKNIRELIALARSKPEAVIYASSGAGSVVHISTALFESATGIRMLHVPYKGSTPGRVAVAAGEANLMFDGLLPTLPLIKAGKLRALGITAAKRLAIVPDIPAIAETVPGFNADTWNGIMAPRGTPPAIIAKIHAVIAQALQQPEVREKLASQGGEASGMPPQEFAAFLQAETAKWGKVVRDTGAKPE